MGQTTANIGIYIPAAGETNYDASFAAGMINIDQHDHSGGPNKGVPISGSGISDFAVTYQKLNANVVDTTTGIGVHGAPLENQLQLLGIVKNLYQLSLLPTTGFIAMNGSNVAGRTFQDAGPLTWTNPAGIAGDPSVNFTAGYLADTIWTPTIISTGGGTPVYTVQAGYYFKIGSLIYFYGAVAISGIGTLGAGDISIGGFPAIFRNVSNYNPSFLVDWGLYGANGVPIPAGSTSMYMRGTSNTLTASLVKIGAAPPSVSFLTLAEFTATGNAPGIGFSGMYLTT